MLQRIATTVIEPNALLREGLTRILSSEFEVVASASALGEVEDDLSASDAQLLVLGVGDRPETAPEHLRRFYAGGANRAAVVLGSGLDPRTMAQLFRAGARACLPQDTTSELLIKALQVVTLGGAIVPDDILPQLCEEGGDRAPESLPGQADASDTPHLSTQEKRILRHLVDGASNKIIARKVDIAEATVKVHVKAILRKVRLQNRTQAAVWALNNGAILFGDAAPARKHDASAQEPAFPMQPIAAMGLARTEGGGKGL